MQAIRLSVADKTSSTLLKLIHVYFSTFKTIIKEMKKGKKLSVMSMSQILRFWNLQLIKLTEQSKLRRPHIFFQYNFQFFSNGKKVPLAIGKPLIEDNHFVVFVVYVAFRKRRGKLKGGPGKTYLLGHLLKILTSIYLSWQIKKQSNLTIE